MNLRTNATEPLPTIEDLLPDFSKAKIISVVDAKNGFWHVELGSLVRRSISPKVRLSEGMLVQRFVCPNVGHPYV
jgi:hypothetical protein